MRRLRLRGVAAITAIGSMAVGAACDSEGAGNPTAPATSDPADSATAPTAGLLADVLATPSAGGWRTHGDDAVEVWVCRVPPDATAAIYGGLPLRLPLTPEGVTEVVSAHVTPYFEQLSHGRYRPVFTTGGEVSIAATAEPNACVDAAIAGAADSARAVLVVADAEHAEGQPGGFGNGGAACAADPDCPPGITRRAAYVGASDFHPDWGDDPPMDLVQHEIGHTLGWVHSGVDDAGRYLSGLDLMSNSAAPREVDGARRDAPGTLALNLFLAGWLPAADVQVVAGEADVTLAPSAGDAGTRLIVLDHGAGLVHTVELLADDGFADHLPADGVAVHEVQLVNGSIARITPLVGEAPFTDLLQPGAVFEFDGWQLTVDDDWTVHLRAAAAAE